MLFRGLRFSSWHSGGSSQPFATPVPGYPLLSSVLCGHYILWSTGIPTGKAPINNKINSQKKDVPYIVKQWDIAVYLLKGHDPKLLRVLTAGEEYITVGVPIHGNEWNGK